MEPIATTLANLCHELSFDDLPPDAVRCTRDLLLDFTGVAARGAMTPSAKSVQELAAELDPSGTGAVVIGTPLRVRPDLAALANGVAAHSIELDDVVNSASLHPGVAVTPVALAAASLVSCTGMRLIAAIAAGYEVMVRLGTALDPAAHYGRGFHPTGTCGVFGAAVAAGKVLDLSAAQLTHALGIAGSQAAGLLEFLSDGTFTKRLHAGWAAHGGLLAALLARRGFTGPATVLEGRHGFLGAYSDRADPAAVLRDWGAPFQVQRTSIKPHACCRYMQGPIDAVLALTRRHGLNADDIRRITVGVLSGGTALVADPAERKAAPHTVVDTQFSMPFGAAVAVIFGDAGLDRFTAETAARPDVKELMAKVECTTDPELDRHYPAAWPATATIATRAGDTYTTRVDYPKGDPENPLSGEELRAKFDGLTTGAWTADQRSSICGMTQNLCQLNDVAQLVAVLSA